MINWGFKRCKVSILFGTRTRIVRMILKRIDIRIHSSLWLIVVWGCCRSRWSRNLKRSLMISIIAAIIILLVQKPKNMFRVLMLIKKYLRKMICCRSVSINISIKHRLMGSIGSILKVRTTRRRTVLVERQLKQIVVEMLSKKIASRSWRSILDVWIVGWKRKIRLKKWKWESSLKRRKPSIMMFSR